MSGNQPGPAGGRRRPTPSRRLLLLGATGALAGLSLDACSSGPAPVPYTADLRTVALAAAVENQAVSAYQALEAALRTGRLGRPVPALAAFVRTTTAHHALHAATWNAVLRDARRPPVTGVPLSGHGRLLDSITEAPSLSAAVSVLQGLESRAAQTHIASAGTLHDQGPALLAAATIAPVEAMHAAALGWLLGGPSVVPSLLGTERAASDAELTIRSADSPGVR
jgi:hypothetical protein